MRAVRILFLLGSWWLTAALLLALWAAYLALSFSGNPYPAWVAFLFRSPGGITIYLVLIVNLITASFRIALARFRRTPLSPAYLRAMDSHVELPLPDAGALARAAELFRSQIGPAELTAGGMRHLTGTWSFLPGTIFRAGLVLVMLGLMVTAHARRTADTAMREGERTDLLGLPVTVAGIIADLPEDHLQVGEDGTFLLKGVSARIDVGGTIAKVTPGLPARLKGRWYRIRHLGYSQALSVTQHGSRSVLTADLDLLPPGRSTAVPLPSGTAMLTFSLDPDRTITKGLLTGRQYNLASPAYRVQTQAGAPREDRRGKRMQPGDRVVLGPVQVSLGEQGLSIRLQVVADPGLPLLYAGSMILLAGLCTMLSRFFWYEREFALMVHEGALLVGARDEFYSKWGVERLQRWSDAFEALNLP